MDTSSLLAKLRDTSPGGAVERLAALSVDALLDKPASHFVDAALVDRTVRAALTEWLASPTSLQALNRWVEHVVNELGRDDRRLREVLDPGVRESMRRIVERPFSPDRRVVLSLIDRDPTRELVRELLLEAILDFGKRVSAPMSGMAKGLGTFARMASESVKARSGGLGSLVGAVSGEVERQLEKRAAEFVDAALGGVLGKIADAISDPRRADEAAQLRLSFVDGAMELTLRQLSRELMNADVPGAAKMMQDGMKRWLESARSADDVRGLTERALASIGAKPLRELLSEAGLLESVRQTAIETFALRVADVTTTEPFAQWLTSLEG